MFTRLDKLIIAGFAVIFLNLSVCAQVWTTTKLVKDSDGRPTYHSEIDTGGNVRVRVYTYYPGKNIVLTDRTTLFNKSGDPTFFSIERRDRQNRLVSMSNTFVANGVPERATRETWNYADAGDKLGEQISERLDVRTGKWLVSPMPMPEKVNRMTDVAKMLGN